MSLEDLLMLKMTTLNGSLDDFNKQLENMPSLKTEEDVKEKARLYQEMKKLQFKITSTKSKLDDAIANLAFINSIEGKQDLTDEEANRLREIFETRTNDRMQNDETQIPFYKREYSPEEADAIRKEFEATLVQSHPNDLDPDLDAPKR